MRANTIVGPLASSFSRTALLGAMLAPLLCAPEAGAQLVADGHQVFDQSNLGETVETNDQFGSALVAGDFDNDGFDDLAIAAPREDVGAVVDAGSVYVIYGSALGLNRGSRGPTLLHQDVIGVMDTAEVDDRFGTTLAAADFDGDGFDELVVGVPLEDLERDGALWQTDAGAMHVFLGSSIGILAVADDFFTAEHFLLLPDGDLGGVEVGGAVATGRYGSFGAEQDLLTGVPGQDFVNRTEGSSDGLSPGRIEIRPSDWSPPYGRLGSAVALAKLEDAPAERANMLVAAPEKTHPSDPTREIGAVWMQSRDCFPATYTIFGSQDGQELGAALAVGRFFGGTFGTALVASPGRDVGGAASAGLVENYLLSSVACGPQLVTPDEFSQGTPPLSETAEPFDRFGEALAVGDFNDDGYDDAVFGVPGENLFDGTPDLVLDAGVFHVVYSNGIVLADGAEQLWSLSTLGIPPLPNDSFGGAFAVGDFDGDGVDDLAAGAPGAAVFHPPSSELRLGAGLVVVLYGSAPTLFRDDFESGDVSAWSASSP